MGKNRDRESLIRVLVNKVVHQILMIKTNKPESRNHLLSEIVEYRGLTSRMYNCCNWNEDDIKYIKGKVLENVRKKMKNKYDDVKFSEKEAERLLEGLLRRVD